MDLVELALDKLKTVRVEPVKADGGTGGRNVRAGAVSSTGEVYYNAHPCHGFLKQYKNAQVLFSQYMHHPEIDSKIDKAYFSWIMGEGSPYRSFHGRTYNLIDPWEGFVWDKLDLHPSNFQQSFLVATRMPKEWKDDIERWYRWYHDFNIDPSVSFVFQDVFRRAVSEGVKSSLSGMYVVNRSNKYDWPVDICTSTEDTLRNFCLGKVEKLNKPYSEDQVYKPVNRIWGDNGLLFNDKETYPNKIFSVYKDSHGLPETECEKIWSIGGSFSKFDYNTHWFVSESDIINIMHSEQKRLKIV